MKQLTVLFLLMVFLPGPSMSQRNDWPDSNYIITLNQQIDNFVMKQDLKALDTLYADDLVFTHGTKKIEGKSEWLNTVRQARYPMRQHDSVTVEVHPGTAVVRGRMSIQRIDKQGSTKYYLKYERVYAIRKGRWQMISHFTFWEFDEPTIKTPNP